MDYSVDSAQDKILAVTAQYYVPVGDIVVYQVNVKKWRNVALDLFEFELQTVACKFGQHIEGDSRLGKVSIKVKLNSIKIWLSLDFVRSIECTAERSERRVRDAG